MSDFVMKDSGERQEFDTGARRDLQVGKGRPDLIPTLFIQRLADVMEKGAEKYGDRNWEKGMPLSRYYASALRHLMQAFNGETDEDHLGQAAFNVAAFMWTQEMVKHGVLPGELNDIPVRETKWWPATGYAELDPRANALLRHEERHEERMKDPEYADAYRLERAGLVECLDGVWRPGANKDVSVKNPGEVQTPIYSQSTVVKPTMDAVRYGETGELK